MGHRTIRAMSSSRPARPILPALAVLVLSVAVYLPGALTNRFAYDDDRFILASQQHRESDLMLIEGFR